MMSMFRAGYRGKTVDMECCCDRHRTSISHFLRNGSICDDTLALSMKQRVIQLENVVLLTYLKKAFGKEKSLRVFISTNADLSTIFDYAANGRDKSALLQKIA